MKSKYFVILTLWALVLLSCDSPREISREEIPAIKAGLAALEAAIKARDLAGLDTLLSPEAADAGVTARTVMDFVCGAGGNEFAGFSDRQFFYRGDAARVDCRLMMISSEERRITLTLRKGENGWRLKNIGIRTSEALPPADSTNSGD